MMPDGSSGRISVGRPSEELGTMTDAPTSGLVQQEHHPSSPTPGAHQHQQQHYTQLEAPAHLQAGQQYYYHTREGSGGAIVSALQYGTSTVHPPESTTPPGHNGAPPTWSPPEHHNSLSYTSPSLPRTYSPYGSIGHHQQQQQQQHMAASSGASSGLEALPHGSPRPGELPGTAAPPQSYPSPVAVGMVGRGYGGSQYGAPVSPEETKPFGSEGIGHEGTPNWQVQNPQLYHQAAQSDSHLHHTPGHPQHHQPMATELQHPTTIERGKKDYM